MSDENIETQHSEQSEQLQQQTQQPAQQQPRTVLPRGVTQSAQPPAKGDPLSGVTPADVAKLVKYFKRTKPYIFI